MSGFNAVASKVKCYCIFALYNLVYCQDQASGNKCFIEVVMYFGLTYEAINEVCN